MAIFIELLLGSSATEKNSPHLAYHVVLYNRFQDLYIFLLCLFLILKLYAQKLYERVFYMIKHI